MVSRVVGGTLPGDDEDSRIVEIDASKSRDMLIHVSAISEVSLSNIS